MSSDSSNVIGFYRWTNIYYNWPDYYEGNSVIQSALRSFLHPNSMCHPDHPFFSEQENGVVMWIGTLQNGRMRLMFSAAQVEFIRHWLCNMGFGALSDIKIPNSSYLLKENIELSAVSPFVFKTAESLKNANKEIDKRNKRIGSNEKLILQRAQFEKARNAWHSQIANWMAVDFETWERDHTIITEVGISIQQHRGPVMETVTRKTIHFIVREHTGFQNSVFVKGNRDHFKFGMSDTLPRNEVIQRLKKLITFYSAGSPLFMIFHGGADDERILRDWDIPTGSHKLGTIYTEEFQTGNMYLFDTTDFFAALCGNPNEQQKLERMAQHLGVQNVFYLHNAGNDAHYTLECMIAMVSGEPVDIQREKRWPYTGMRKSFKPQKGDPDYASDEEEGPVQLYPPELVPEPEGNDS